MIVEGEFTIFTFKVLLMPVLKMPEPHPDAPETGHVGSLVG